MAQTYNQISQSAHYKQDAVAVSLTVCGGSYGGGSEVLVIQDITGTLSPGGHPGSYNGQDAYNGMLIADDLLCRERTTTSGTSTGEGGCIEHDARCPDIVSGGGYNDERS